MRPLVSSFPPLNGLTHWEATSSAVLLTSLTSSAFPICFCSSPKTWSRCFIFISALKKNPLPIRRRNFPVKLSIRAIHFIMLIMFAITGNMDRRFPRGSDLQVFVISEGRHAICPTDESDDDLGFGGPVVQKHLLLWNERESPT